MHVEDHPLEYGGFEGIIPQGEYGGGTVMLWDRGTWEPQGDPNADYRDGKLKFELHGEKLQGGWMLVRKGGSRGPSDERVWFLFKERDKFAKTSPEVTTKLPLSVTSGRDMDEIAEQANRVWGSGGEIPRNGQHKGVDTVALPVRATAKRKDRAATKVTAPKSVRTKVKRLSTTKRASLLQQLKAAGAKRAPFLRSPSVELATLTKTAPEGDGWLHEIKFDGYRMLSFLEQGTVRFISRNGKDWTSKFPNLVRAVTELPVSRAIMDGEIVVMQPDGTTSFQALQNAFQAPASAPFEFFVFDLLYLEGYDTRSVPIEDRKQLLRKIVSGAKRSAIKFSDHVVGTGREFFAEAARLHLEGIISKRLGSSYVGERSTDWLKVKCSLREEFVIGGFTAPGGSRTNFGALALGYFDQRHQLQYAGRVGTGFDDTTLAAVHQKLLKLVQAKSPFANLSGTSGQARGVTWVKPQLVAQIEFSQWTKDGQLRHPSFQGLREDKPAREVVRDNPIERPSVKPPTKAKHMSKAVSARKRGTAKPKSSSEQTAQGDGSVEVAGVRLSHPEKVLYREAGYTKLDLAHYYEHVARWMLPHVENRLLSLVRCPAGSGQKCFFQKHPGDGTPEVLRRFKVKEKSEVEEYLALNDLAGLISLVQMGVLEIHLWGSQADHFEKPDRLIFDLDPDPSVAWSQVIVAAREVKLLLEELGLTSFVKTTGGKGLHVVIPIRRTLLWPEAKAFCRSVADLMVAAAPDRYIATMSKAKRKGKIFVDYLRNDRGATAIAPYSTRARDGAPVSVPLTWDELSDQITSDHFTIANLPERLSKLRKDPWADIFKVRQAITAPMLRRLEV
jgi:bifunctional non-homologous end joining protein LigD